MTVKFNQLSWTQGKARGSSGPENVTFVNLYDAPTFALLDYSSSIEISC